MKFSMSDFGWIVAVIGLTGTSVTTILNLIIKSALTDFRVKLLEEIKELMTARLTTVESKIKTIEDRIEKLADYHDVTRDDIGEIEKKVATLEAVATLKEKK